MAPRGHQLTTFLYGLGAGRRRLPALPPALPPAQQQDWALGTDEGEVLLGGVHPAIQMDDTTCGSAAIVVAQASDATQTVAAQLGLTGEANIDAAYVKEKFESLQRATKQQTNKRHRLFTWPHSWGTPPWGAARTMRFSGHAYYDRMVVDTSLPQSTRVLTHAAQCAQRGYPVLLYVGGDTSMRWNAGMPRHVVVLHAAARNAEDVETLSGLNVPRTGDAHDDAQIAELARTLNKTLKDAYDVEPDCRLYIYDPATGRNVAVTLRDLIDQKTPKAALGGWPHITWVVLPKLAGTQEKK
ncbi:hypothetical protein [Timonella sp. A28]|uniref:hypothetical protein n=1 Tax=Timonella sp. A28 TaxID=3442640 RepID=UPI003EB87DE2